MKYVVFWSLFTWVSLPCPSVNVKDKFGREFTQFGMSTCSVIHGEWKYVGNKSKTFLSKDSAIVFYREALSESRLFFSHSIDSVKLDSIQ